MCNPTLAVAAASSALQYQQSVKQQKAERDAQIRQNEIALANLNNRRASLQTKITQKTKKNLKILGIKEREARRNKAEFKASDRGIGGNTYQFLVQNFDNNLADVSKTVLGNIEFDRQQFRRDYLNLNALYDSQSTYVTNVDRKTPALVAGLSYSKSYFDYKNKLAANEISKPKYGYEDFDFNEYERDRM
jgi:hypothetical protein